MLTRIEIHDFALIEQAVLIPEQGLLILTGETGAGKSILIDAIGALGGGRIGRDMIRHGQERASVEAVFHNPGNFLPIELLEELGISDQENSEEADELILSREILSSGKSVCRVNGRMVALTVLRDITGYLIDIHGQHDQQSIFRTETHIQLLDRYGAEQVNPALAEYQAVLQEYQACLHQQAELGQDPAERARLVDMLQYQTREIEAARIKANEDETLSQRRRVVANAEKISAALSEAYELLEGDSSAAILAALGQVVSRIEPAVRNLPDLQPQQSQIQEALYLLQGAAGDLRSALEKIESDPGELDKIDERLDQLFRLKKKYGGSLEAVRQFYLRASEKLDQMSEGEARYEKLQQLIQKSRQQLLLLGSQLTARRREAAAGLERRITDELSELGMKGVRFAVDFSPADPGQKTFGRNGLDKIEFMISANPGEPLKPLARIASGGEASRIMLAVKSILAQADRIPILIFDEIDTGVSGRTAGRVAEKMQRLSRNRQIFCITHLAQIAAMADKHLLIEKSVAQEQTRTKLIQLDGQGRESELARLLSGGVGDETARQLAGQLLAQARQFKEINVPGKIGC